MRIHEALIPVICWLLLLAPMGAAEESQPARGDVDAVFAEYDSTRTPGCSMAVMHDGEIAYARGYGMANLEYGIALTARSVFRIASTSKQFTAMAMALLAEKGKLDLDADLRDVLPEMHAYDPPVTVRQLVHHTSGIRDYLVLASLADLGEVYSVDQAYELIARQKTLNFPAGDQHLYSNSGYFLMSLIVERVTGESLADWAEKNIFRPLGMRHTHFHDDHRRIVKQRADGYAPTADGYEISMTMLDMVGDGGVYTTVEDLLAWDRNFYDNQLGRGGPELIELVTTPGKLNSGEKLSYAFGLDVGEHQGSRLIRHGGAFVGYRAEMVRFPERRLSVAVLCNVASAQPSRLALEVADLYLGTGGAGDEEKSEEEASAPAAREPLVEVAAAELERVTGSYWNESVSAPRHIEVVDGKLLYRRGGGRDSELGPLGDGRFRMLGIAADVVITFEPADAPERMLLSFGGGEPSVSERFEPAVLTVKDRAAIAGTYHCDELGVSYEVEDRDEVLTVVLPRGGTLALEPQRAGTFSAGGRGMLTLQHSEGGEVTSFTLDAGRVRGLRFVKR